MSPGNVHMYPVHGIPEKCAFIGTLQLNTQPMQRNTQQTNQSINGPTVSLVMYMCA